MALGVTLLRSPAGAPCHESCGGHCWGPGPEDCQKCGYQRGDGEGGARGGGQGWIPPQLIPTSPQ